MFFLNLPQLKWVFPSYQKNDQKNLFFWGGKSQHFSSTTEVRICNNGASTSLSPVTAWCRCRISPPFGSFWRICRECLKKNDPFATLNCFFSEAKKVRFATCIESIVHETALPYCQQHGKSIVCHFVADVGIGGNLWNTFFERTLLELRFLGTKRKVQSTKLKVPTAEGTCFPKVHH